MTKSEIMIAMVALNDNSMPSEEKVFDFLNETWDDVPEMSNISRKNDIFVFEIADAMGSFALMPAPIPRSDLEGPCNTAWYWPEACDKLRSHKAHVIVSLIAKKLQPKDAAILLTKLVASVTANSDAAGIYWGSGTVGQSPEDFVEGSKHMSAENLPLTLWNDVVGTLRERVHMVVSSEGRQRISKGGQCHAT